MRARRGWVGGGGGRASEGVGDAQGRAVGFDKVAAFDVGAEGKGGD